MSARVRMANTDAWEGASVWEVAFSVTGGTTVPSATTRRSAVR